MCTNTWSMDCCVSAALTIVLVVSLVGCSAPPDVAEYEAWDGGSSDDSDAAPEQVNPGEDASTTGDNIEESPLLETCDNGLDDDGDGSVDEECTCTEGETQACYGGHVTNAGRGACLLGQQTCVAAGEFNSWGECVGWIAPSTEICDDGIDQDCDGLDASCSEVCGNTICEVSETCESCPADCGECEDEVPWCGDEGCDGSESCESCPADCGECEDEAPWCGDEGCDGSESCESCPIDCGECPYEPAPCGARPSGTVESRTMYESPTVPHGETCQSETQTRTCIDGEWTEWTGGHTFAECEVEPAPECIDYGVTPQLEDGQNCRGWDYPMTMIQENTIDWSGCCGYLVRECVVEGLSSLNRMYCDADADLWCNPDADGMCQF